MVGKHAVFNYPSEFRSLPEYTAHAGWQVVVLRELTEDEYDNADPDRERMFKIQAEDGWVGDAFESELEEIV